MKIYEVRSGHPDAMRYSEPYIPRGNPWRGECLSTGEYENIHEIPIIYHVDNKIKPFDYHFTSHGLLFSRKLMEVIQKHCSVRNIFPAYLYYKGQEKIFDEHYTIIFPTHEALHYKCSDFEWSESSYKYVAAIYHLVLAKEKLLDIPLSNTIFHLKEHESIILVTETTKIAIEAVTKDVVFIEVEVEE
ncbi:hypothetical protein FACS1894130_13530 [Spirochaetia bacterium]|nr:hypothetical protein FACS1894130_13530 [Spirochaetia bacterium]GHU91629.1 hypothetical protein FACS189476_12310 [Spirochaetia bacterium]